MRAKLPELSYPTILKKEKKVEKCVPLFGSFPSHLFLVFWHLINRLFYFIFSKIKIILLALWKQ